MNSGGSVPPPSTSARRCSSRSRTMPTSTSVLRRSADAVSGDRRRSSQACTRSARDRAAMVSGARAIVSCSFPWRVAPGEACGGVGALWFGDAARPGCGPSVAIRRRRDRAGRASEAREGRPLSAWGSHEFPETSVPYSHRSAPQDGPFRAPLLPSAPLHRHVAARAGAGGRVPAAGRDRGTRCTVEPESWLGGPSG